MSIDDEGQTVVVPVASSMVSGNTVSGDQSLFSLVSLRDSFYLGGCTIGGCSPVFKQPRIYSFTGSAAQVQLSEGVVFLQKEPENQALLFSGGLWGTEVVLTISSADANGVQTYSFTSAIYGSELGASLPSTPIPPKDLRKNIDIAYGLAVDFDDSTDLLTPAIYTFKWRLAQWSVMEKKSASPSYESAECSNRGICNRKKGTCTCFAGYAGYNCGQQAIIL